MLLEKEVQKYLVANKIPYQLFGDSYLVFELPDFLLYPDDMNLSCFIECKVKSSKLNVDRIERQCGNIDIGLRQLNIDTSVMLDYSTMARHHKFRPCYFLICDTTNIPIRFWVHEYDKLKKLPRVYLIRRTDQLDHTRDKGKIIIDMVEDSKFNTIEEAMEDLLKKANTYAIKRNDIKGIGPLWHNSRSYELRNKDKEQIHNGNY